ncbi:MAG: HpcH/HpaI aldolase/citrate lyase family protein [Brevinema sp.]
MEKLYRSWLFCPANNPKLLYSSVNFSPDAIIFDLEDAVPVDEKEDARDLLVEALRTVDYKDILVLARVNPLYTPFGIKDIQMLVPAGLRYIRFPMCDSIDQVKELDQLLTEIEKEYRIPIGSVKIAVALETPKGVYNALSIAQEERVFALSLGAEDFTRTLGATRTTEGKELDYARAKIVLEANIAGVLAVDTVWSMLNDSEGFKKEVLHIKNMGFSGKACIHPSQIEEVHKIYTPSTEELENSLRILEAAKHHGIENGGVIKLDGKMIDIPLIDKADRIVKLARAAGMIERVH